MLGEFWKHWKGWIYYSEYICFINERDQLLCDIMVRGIFSRGEEKQVEHDFEKKIEEINKALKIDKQEEELDQEIRDDLVEVLQNYKDMEQIIDAYRQKHQDNLSMQEMLEMINGTDPQKLRKFKEDIKTMKSDLAEVIEDLRRKDTELKQESNIDTSMEEEIEDLNEDFLQPMIKAEKGLEKMKNQKA
jgi:predicted Zn-dependent peptidase